MEHSCIFIKELCGRAHKLCVRTVGCSEMNVTATLSLKEQTISMIHRGKTTLYSYRHHVTSCSYRHHVTLCSYWQHLTLYSYWHHVIFYRHNFRDNFTAFHQRHSFFEFWCHLLRHTGYAETVLYNNWPREVIWWAAAISTASFIVYFFILTSIQSLSLEIAFLSAGCILHYIFDAQLFLQPQPLPYNEHTTR